MVRNAPAPRSRQAAATLLLPAVAVLAAHMATPAAADAMRVGDLGPAASRTACLDTAARIIGAYIDEIGGFATSGDPENPEEWAIYGWELKPGVNDVVITCPMVAGQVHAFLTVHASGDEAAANADAVAGRIRDLWLGLR